MENQNGNLFNNQQNDELHVALKVVSFCFPIVGAILYFVKKDNEPKAAKQACNLALIGFVVGLVLSIVLNMLGYGMMANY